MLYAVCSFAQTKDYTLITTTTSKLTYLVVIVKFNGYDYNIIDTETGKNKHFGNNQDVIDYFSNLDCELSQMMHKENFFGNMYDGYVFRIKSETPESLTKKLNLEMTKSSKNKFNKRKFDR